MPFGEQGPIDEATRQRMNEILGYAKPAPEEATVLGRKVADLKAEMEAELGEVVDRNDILRRAYAERYV